MIWTNPTFPRTTGEWVERYRSHPTTVASICWANMERVVAISWNRNAREENAAYAVTSI
jgi:hypothetical protein